MLVKQMCSAREYTAAPGGNYNCLFVFSCSCYLQIISVNNSIYYIGGNVEKICYVKIIKLTARMSCVFFENKCEQDRTTLNMKKYKT